jgi:hypothetical protein
MPKLGRWAQGSPEPATAFCEAGDDVRPKDAYLVTCSTRDEPMPIVFEIRVKPDAAPEREAFDPPKLGGKD